MVDQGQEMKAREGERSRRRERANRILDAAAVLILRWGYNKTTIDDISRQAGVAKGTIYLHWKTREELFEALLKREATGLLEDIRHRIAEDTEESTLRSMLKQSVLALMKNPLMKAVLLRDTNVIGKLARSESNSAMVMEKLTGFKAYIEFLHQHRLVRTDISLPEQVYMVSAIYLGYLLAAPMMSNEYAVSDEQLADLMAETAHRTLEPTRTVTSDESKAARQALMQYLDRFAAFMKEQLKQELE